MSITDTDDNSETKAFAGGNATDKDHQPNSMADTEEVKKASSKSNDGEEKEEAAEITNTVTNEEEAEEEEAQSFYFNGKYYDTFQEMVDAKRDRNRRVLERSGATDAAQAFRATASAASADGMYYFVNCF